MLDLIEPRIARDLADLHEHGSMSRARQLSDATGLRFNDATHPLYFTGNPQSRVVLVHLNPKQALEPAGARLGNVLYRTPGDYIDAHRHFGELNYGTSSPGTHRSPFDAKQIEFLRPSVSSTSAQTRPAAPTGRLTWSRSSMRSCSWS